MAAVAAVLRQGGEDSVEHPGSDPRLIAAMAGLVRGIAPRQVLPGGAGLEDPEDPVQHIARVPPGPSTTIGPDPRLREHGGKHRPLLIGEVHDSTPTPRALGV